MPYFPEFDDFQELAATADYVPVSRRLLSDALTPVTGFHNIDDGGPACLFESVIGGEKVGRYSFIATEPYLLLEAWGTEVKATEFGPPAESGGPKQHHTTTFESANPLDELRRRVSEVRVAKAAGLPPFVGGAVGYAGYDTVRYVEHLPNPPLDDRHLPDLAFAFYDHMVVFDNVQKT